MLSRLKVALTKFLQPGEPLLVGVSGGLDSVALLDALVRLGWRPHVCHLNHQWRGAESDADAEFVRRLAIGHGLACTLERQAVGHTEDDARRARFTFFEAVAQRTGIGKIALAHTADDQVETFLLRLLRGAGVPGLVGIWPERQVGGVRVIRPLLDVTRAEVQEYLDAQGLAWREDSSNADRAFARNRVRHDLLPLLEREFNPAIRAVLARTAEILRDEDVYLLHDVAERFYQRACREDAVNGNLLAQYPVAVQRRLLRFWLGGEEEVGGARYGFDHIEAVRALAATESPSAELHLPEDMVVYREYDWLRKARREELVPVAGEWPVALEGEMVIRELGVVLSFCHPDPAVAGEGPRNKDDEILRCAQNDRPGSEVFDADALGDGLSIRTWREGDRFQPLGMNGEKKLQDFFVDEKVPRRQRGRVPLLCAADGRIAWVVGYRMAEPFKVTEKTRRVVRIEVREAKS